MVAAHSDDAVRAATRDAFAALPDLARALACATTLKGVGPALGSAVLRAHSPAVAPYMSDEAMAALPELGAIQYTPAHYLRFARLVQARATELGPPWTAAAVEKALWAEAVLAKLGAADAGDAGGSKAKKRPRPADAD